MASMPLIQGAVEPLLTADEVAVMLKVSKDWVPEEPSS
jgi:hypothetical protein